MNYEIGKIVEFDGFCGKIVSEKEEFLFLKENIGTQKELVVGDLVAFRGEKVCNQNRAYFIKTLEEVMEKPKQKMLENK